MPLQLIKRYTREYIRAHPKDLFVFGDNMIRKGYGGQAAAARDEPNAVGIPTKVSPSNTRYSFFRDGNLSWARSAIDDGFDRLEKHLERGGFVHWPADGIGSGLARLEEKAPQIHAYIQERFERLKKL